MRRALNTIPQGLHDIYRKKLALDVLSWVFSAVRPLKPRELQVAVAVEEDDTEIEADFLTDESTLIDVCGGLVQSMRTVKGSALSTILFRNTSSTILMSCLGRTL